MIFTVISFINDASEIPGLFIPTLFKLYFQFPALAKDTIHIKDSLRREYAHEVQIEQ